jgi:non-heme Fe2+,alpha-ketoglutarate-dependent halogenase
MTKLLSQAQLKCYERDGVLFPLQVLLPDESSRFCAAFEDLETRLGCPQQYVGLSHLFVRWAYDLATHPVVLDAVEDILGPDILVEGTLILCKYPHDQSYLPWHQDGVYSGWYLTPSTSAWIALSDSTSENGCMRVIPGSHRQGRLPHLETHARYSLSGHGEEVQVEVNEAQARDVVLHTGEMSLHQSNTIHGSQPNRSEAKRIGFIVRFVTPQFTFRQAPHPLVRARGHGVCQHLQVLEQPPTDDLASGIAAWRAFSQEAHAAP